VSGELALAVYASETGTHLVRAPAGARYAAHVRAFDGGEYEQRLAAAGLRFVGRGAAVFPALLRSIHDPPPGLFVRGAADVELLSRPAVAVVGARACSGYGAAVARSLARDLAAAGLVVVQRPRARHRRRGAPRRPRGGRHDRRRPRVRHRQGLPGGAPRALAPDRRDRPDRLRVRAGSRARAVAVPGAETQTARSHAVLAQPCGRPCRRRR
jgi:hypothetical protein